MLTLLMWLCILAGGPWDFCLKKDPLFKEYRSFIMTEGKSGQSVVSFVSNLVEELRANQYKVIWYTQYYSDIIAYYYIFGNPGLWHLTYHTGHYLLPSLS